MCVAGAFCVHPYEHKEADYISLFFSHPACTSAPGEKGSGMYHWIIFCRGTQAKNTKLLVRNSVIPVDSFG